MNWCLERLSNPTSQCSTTGTMSAPLATQMSTGKEHKKNPAPITVEESISELREAPETRMKMSAVNQSTGDPKSTPNFPRGLYLTESREVRCETSALPPGISSLTTRSTSSLPNHISSTQGLPPSSPTWSGSPFCLDS